MRSTTRDVLSQGARALLACVALLTATSCKCTSECDTARTRLTNAWTDERKKPVADAQRKVIDAVFTRLSEASTSCSKTTSACLAARIDHLDAVTRALADPTLTARASTLLIARLEGPCQPTDVVLSAPADSAAAVSAVRAEIIAVDGLRLSGSLEDAEKRARAAIENAAATKWEPVQAEAHFALSQTLRTRSQPEESEKALTQAATLAASSNHVDVTMRVAMTRIVMAWQLNRFDEAEKWVTQLQDLLAKSPRVRLGAELDVIVTALRVSQGRLDDAMAASDRALKVLVDTDPLGTADVRMQRASVFLQLGFDGRALDEVNAVMAIRQPLLGDSHALTVQARVMQGEAQARCGLVKQAVDQLTATLEVVRSRQDVGPFTAASAMSGLSLALELGGQPAEALNVATRAEELVKEVGTPRAVSVATRELTERLFAVGRERDALTRLDVVVADQSGRDQVESIARRALMRAKAGIAGAGDDVEFVVAHPDAGEGPLVSARLALAWSADSTDEQRAAALELARKVRGQYHPDVARALMLQKKLGDERAAKLLEEQLQKIEVVESAL